MSKPSRSETFPTMKEHAIVQFDTAGVVSSVLTQDTGQAGLRALIVLMETTYADTARVALVTFTPHNRDRNPNIPGRNLRGMGAGPNARRD